MSIHIVGAYGYPMEFLHAIAERLPSQRQLRKLKEEQRMAFDPESDGSDEESVEAYVDRVLAAHIPPAIMMHSFGGSATVLTQLLRLRHLGDRIYFSFSRFVHGRMDRQRALELMRACPRDRLLLESDMHRFADVGEAMAEVLSFVAEARGWTLQEAAEVTWENACRFYGVPLPLSGDQNKPIIIL
jgi:Tat protein secretion system quality control protein TatD with DNase activity